MQTDITGKLLICCPDRPGIVAGVSQFLYNCGANILDASQHSTDPREGLFFMRMEFHLKLKLQPPLNFKRSYRLFANNGPVVFSGAFLQ